jgi:hypothetical protein
MTQVLIFHDTFPNGDVIVFREPIKIFEEFPEKRLLLCGMK